MAAKSPSFYIFAKHFWFLRDLVLINLCLMIYDRDDLYSTFKFKMVTANTQIKAIFMHVNYIIISNIC